MLAKREMPTEHTVLTRNKRKRLKLENDLRDSQIESHEEDKSFTLDPNNKRAKKEVKKNIDHKKTKKTKKSKKRGTPITQFFKKVESDLESSQKNEKDTCLEDNENELGVGKLSISHSIPKGSPQKEEIMLGSKEQPKSESDEQSNQDRVTETGEQASEQETKKGLTSEIKEQPKSQKKNLVVELKEKIPKPRKRGRKPKAQTKKPDKMDIKGIKKEIVSIKNHFTKIQNKIENLLTLFPE
jgi:hypothetical protein